MTFMMRRIPGFFACLPLLSLAGCSRSDPAPGASVPSFHDVTEAPAAIQTAARAVVRIETADAFATGSFISATGLLLTNNHVLGVGVCPREGCFAQITRMHQLHSAKEAAETIFVVPTAVDVGLDMAVLQAYSTDAAGNRSGQLVTPSFLAFDPKDPASLEGTHVNIVGHPEGRLKKWTQGDVIDSSGEWITSTAFILPGNSGSPILGDDGKIIGILHRGPTSQDLLTSNGADTYSVGTASAPLVAAMSAALPAALVSTAAATTDDDLVAHEAVFRNAHTTSASVNGAPKLVLDSLAAACDKGLARQDIASPEDLDAALAACYAAERWVECRTDMGPGSFGVCPSTPDAVDAWRGRFASVEQHWRALNGAHDLEAVSFALAALETSQAAGLAKGASSLQSALTQAGTPLDFGIAGYLAAFGVTIFGGTSLPDYVRGYAKVPHYEISGTSVAVTALWLNHDEALSADDARAVLVALAGDAKVDIGTKLYVEDVRYNSGDLN
jgi:V8-like Glu-specific endopeptidase